MKRGRAVRATQSFERALAATRSGRCVLKLYIAGATHRSVQALERARRLCDVELQGRCELKVIDVYQQPHLARAGQIIATPTLVKESPPPVRRFIGTLEDTARILIGLDLQSPGEIMP